MGSATNKQCDCSLKGPRTMSLYEARGSIFISYDWVDIATNETKMGNHRPHHQNTLCEHGNHLLKTANTE